MNQVNQQEKKQYQPEIYLVDNFTQDECWFLIDYFRHNRNLCTVGSSFDYQAITRHTIRDNKVRKLLNRLTFENLAFLSGHLNRPMYPEMSILAEWPIGGQQHPHVDTYSTYELDDPTDELQEDLDNLISYYKSNDFPAV